MRHHARLHYTNHLLASTLDAASQSSDASVLQLPPPTTTRWTQRTQRTQRIHRIRYPIAPNTRSLTSNSAITTSPVFLSLASLVLPRLRTSSSLRLLPYRLCYPLASRLLVACLTTL